MSQNPSRKRGAGARKTERRSTRQPRIALPKPEWHIANAERDYLETGNPLYAWDAYCDARAAHLPIPEWVAKYLDRVGRRFFDMRRRQIPRGSDGDIARAVLDALELRPRGGKGPTNPFMRLVDIGHQMSIAFEVYSQLQTLPHTDPRDGRESGGHAKEASAFQRVLEVHRHGCDYPATCHLSISTIRAYWKRHQQFLPVPAGLKSARK